MYKVVDCVCLLEFNCTLAHRRQCSFLTPLLKVRMFITLIQNCSKFITSAFQFLYNVQILCLGNPHLAAITGALVTCQVRTHKFLSKVMHLLPENCLLGTHDVVPGMVDGPSDVKATIPGGKLALYYTFDSFPSVLNKIKSE